MKNLARHYSEAVVHMFFSKIGVFLKLSNIHKKAPVLRSLFSKVADLKSCSLTKKRLQHRFCFVDIETVLKSAFL